MKLWPQATIRELLAQADAHGVARAVMASPREASLFRFAIYSFRRTHGFAPVSTVTLDGSTVVVTRKEQPAVTILQPEGQQT